MAEPLMIALLAGGYALLFVLERAFPLRRTKARLLPRLTANFLVSLAALAAVLVVVSPVSSNSLDWVTRSSFGLMHFLGLSPAVEVVVMSAC